MRGGGGGGARAGVSLHVCDSNPEGQWLSGRPPTLYTDWKHFLFHQVSSLLSS